MKKRTRQGHGGRLGLLLTLVVFAAALAIVWLGVGNLAGGADEQGAEAARRAIERAAVLCYATEGYYPPSLAYISTHYGVEVDRSLYAVRYNVQAPNLMPSIHVVRHGA